VGVKRPAVRAHPNRWSHPGRTFSLVTLGGLGLLAACAQTRALDQTGTEESLTATVTSLRAQNANYLRQIEELENEVFVLSGRLPVASQTADSGRRPHGDADSDAPRISQPVSQPLSQPPFQPRAEPEPAVELPHVLLDPRRVEGRPSQSDRVDSGANSVMPSLANRPSSAAEHAADQPATGFAPLQAVEVHYAGAAAQSEAARPVLRLYGPGSADSADQRPAMPRLALQTPLKTDQAPADQNPASQGPQNVDQPRGSSRATERHNQGLSVVVETGERGLAKSRTKRGKLDSSLAERRYKAALAQLSAGQHAEAAARFRRFLRAHPRHDLADNAQYWLGECYYDLEDFVSASREFRRVVEAYPQGNKVPDALLKAGFAYIELGQTRAAERTLRELTRSYPTHPSAHLAAERLARAPGQAPGQDPSQAPKQKGQP